MKPLVFLWTLVMLAGCQHVAPRPAMSSVGCLRAVRDQVQQQVGADVSDKHLHCVVSAHLARQCSVAEAWLAGLGKELADLVSAGDAEWADWQADRAGIHCGRTQADDADIATCCQQQRY